MLNIAIIGSGFIAGAHAAAINNSEKVNLAGIANPNEVSVKKAAEAAGCKWFTDIEKMLKEEDIDIVDICVPTFLHEQYVLMAAKHGKNILCEKPVALNVESFDNMVKAAEEAGVRFMVAQVLRFWPEYVDIKKRYAAGEFGEVKYVYANRLGQHPTWTKWHVDPAKSGGGLYDMMLHDIDFVRYVFGPVKEVYAAGWQSETGCWNHVMANLIFENGVKAGIEGSMAMTDNYPFNMNFRIVGENKSEEYNLSAGLNLEDVASAKRQEIIFENGKDPVLADVDQSEDAYQNEIEYFADCVESGKETDIVPLEENRNVLEIEAAIQKSLETGEVVKL